MKRGVIGSIQSAKVTPVVSIGKVTLGVSHTGGLIIEV
jgi:hypothetical protein